MGNPGQWVPVESLEGSKGPDDILWCKSCSHLRIFVDIEIVIQINEVMTGQPVEYHESCQDQ